VILAMTPSERDAFLAGVHVGVLSVAEPGRAPLTVPVWYAYEPGGLVTVLTGRTSRKAELLEQAQRLSLCAQTETAPYQYVSVEGPVVRVDTTVDGAERQAMAYRYLGREFGDLYLAATEADAAEEVAIRMRPERWRTVDYNKQFG
jgi:nitroimidazol reductase NimA-like FMN-containing flavoprotein (pyridoxamine 5'-phosphate oxidase superfamily)